MYDKKSIRVVAGGLVTSIPGDTLQDDESQELLNFSTDSLGALHSRRGHTVRCSTSDVVAMARALGGLWVGASGGLGPDCGSVLPGGDPLGFFGWQDLVFSTGGGMRISDGSSNWRWIPQAPTTKPTAKASATVETTVVDFNSGFTVDPPGDDSYTPGLQIFPSSDDSSYYATKDIVLDLAGGHSLDEVHRIKVWAKNWDRVKAVTFEVDCNTGNFDTDYFTARMKRKHILGGIRETVTFYVRARPLEVDNLAQDKKNYGSFARIGSTPDKGWNSCVKVRVKVQFFETTKMRFDTWVAVGNEDNKLEGDNLRASYTYTTDAGHESNPSPFSDFCTVNQAGIAVSDMTVSGDPQVTGMNIYLTGSTIPGVLRVNEEPIPQATTYSITAGFDDLTNLNIQLENDHDDPPAAEGLIGPYYNRAIAWKGSRYYWSHVNKPYAFAQPDGEFGDWAALEEGLGSIKAATMRPGTLWFFCENGVAILQGDPGGPASAQHRASVQMGIQSQQGVFQASEGDYANMIDGIFRFNGDAAVEISRKIQPVFKGGWNSQNAAIGVASSVVWCSDGTQTFKWDALLDRWFEDSRAFTCFYSDGGSLIGAMTSGQVVELESGFFDDDGSAINVAFTSKAYDADLKSDEKRWGDFEVWANTGGSTLTVQAILSSPDQTITLGQITSTGEQRFVLPFATDGEGIDARKCAIRITGSVQFECTLFAMQLWYYPKAREGKSFDTGEQSYGTHRVKLLREIVLDVDNPAVVGITVKSDRPQPMDDRDTSHTLAVTTDRRMQPIVFEEEIIGRLFRVVLHGNDFLCYGGKALFQAFGTYLEDGEYYLSDVLDFGTERVKLLKECEVVYSTTAQATLTVETDLPGDALVTRTTFNLPATTGEESIKLRFAGDVKARLVRLRLTPTAALRVEAIRLWLKMIGAPNATPWQWVNLPVAATQDAIWSDIGFPQDQSG